MQRIFSLAVICLAITALAACGDDDSKNNGNNGNNGTSNNSNNGTNSNNGESNNSNNGEDPQCSAALEACTAGEPTAVGFVCEDAGEGAKCYLACTPPASEDEQYPCPASQACTGATGDTFCLPSQCTGWTDSAGCQGIADANPGSFPNGAFCAPGANESNICFPAGAAVEGAACVEIDDCQPGLLCLNETCSAICGADSECDETGGERCLGVDDADFLDANIGLCEVGCDSYSQGQCGTGEGCTPITGEDGLCNPIGTKAFMDVCDPAATTAECGEGMGCLRFQAADVPNNIPEVSVCLPICNSGAVDQAAADATCPTSPSGLTSFCLDASEEPGPRGGICLETCESTDYGLNKCTSSPAFSCTPLRGERHVCFPAGTEAVGEACDPENTAVCAEGSTCEARGDGTGICTAWCEPTAGTLPACGGDETCNAFSDAAFNFGVCGTECTPAGFADTTSCPANLQTCFPQSVTDPVTPSFCSASGDAALGESCPSISVNGCVAGNACANEVNFGFGGNDDIDNPATCTAYCDPMGDNSECGENEGCSVNFLTADINAGICADKGTNDWSTATAFGDCSEVGKLCHQRGICVEFAGGENGCYIFCDPNSTAPGNCPSGSGCTTSVTNQDGNLVDLRQGDFAVCVTGA